MHVSWSNHTVIIRLSEIIAPDCKNKNLLIHLQWVQWELEMLSLANIKNTKGYSYESLFTI